MFVLIPIKLYFWLLQCCIMAIRKCDASSLHLLSQDCYGYLQSCGSIHILGLFSHFLEKCHWSFDRILLNLEIVILMEGVSCLFWTLHPNPLYHPGIVWIYMKKSWLKKELQRRQHIMMYGLPELWWWLFCALISPEMQASANFWIGILCLRSSS